MTHTREAEVQKAREWFWADQDHPGVETDDAETVVAMLAAYAAHSLRVELGELAKEMCAGCQKDQAITRSGHLDTFNGKTNICYAALIHRLIAELEEEGTNAD